MVKRELIPAVSYLRKSTRGERKGHERQEKSLPQQEKEIAKLADGKYKVV